MSTVLRAALLLGITSCTSTSAHHDVPDETGTTRTVQLQSAGAALERVFGVLARHTQGSNRIILSDIDANGTREGVRVRLEMSIPAEDDVVAAERFGALSSAFLGEPWCAGIGRATTRPFYVDSKVAGLVIERFHVDVKEPASGMRVALVDQTDLNAFIRGVAASGPPSIGVLEIRSNSHERSEGIESRYSVARHGRKATPLEDVLDFVSRLENDERGTVVTKISLTPYEQSFPLYAAEGWEYELVVSAFQTQS